MVSRPVWASSKVTSVNVPPTSRATAYRAGGTLSGMAVTSPAAMPWTAPASLPPAHADQDGADPIESHHGVEELPPLHLGQMHDVLADFGHHARQLGAGGE